ncbi:MAG: universal stress protein [Burkholderiales bacterium]|nr:universal stress protein [Nitrosomonas sp.]MCP5273403.1 universal stress protein [Burkholderiales bacterium]
MYQRILVPVDGSATSNHALKEAIKFARLHHAQLKLIHVLEDMGYFDIDNYINYTELVESVRDSVKKMLEKATELVRQEGVVVAEKLLEAQGRRVANVIADEAIQWPADLIIIGTHGRSGFNRLLLGSIAEGVLRTAKIPILLIRCEDGG